MTRRLGILGDQIPSYPSSVSRPNRDKKRRTGQTTASSFSNYPLSWKSYFALIAYVWPRTYSLCVKRGHTLRPTTLGRLLITRRSPRFKIDLTPFSCKPVLHASVSSPR